MAGKTPPHTEKLQPWALQMGSGDLTSKARQTSLPHYPGDTTSLVIYPSLSSPTLLGPEVRKLVYMWVRSCWVLTRFEKTLTCGGWDGVELSEKEFGEWSVLRFFHLL